MKQNSPFQVQCLGLIDYTQALSVMNRMRDQRLTNSIPDTLLFLEHPPVITMGRQKSADELKLSGKELEEKGIQFIETDRGGRLTYHGPGQLIVYFICDYQKRTSSIDKWVWSVEEGVRLLLNQYDIQAERNSRNPGLWIDDHKIASVGFHIQKGITTHGVALNINSDLEPFSYMIPCGLEGVGTTSIKDQKGIEPGIKEVSNILVSCYSEVFDCPIEYK